MTVRSARAVVVRRATRMGRIWETLAGLVAATSSRRAGAPRIGAAGVGFTGMPSASSGASGRPCNASASRAAAGCARATRGRGVAACLRSAGVAAVAGVTRTGAGGVRRATVRRRCCLMTRAAAARTAARRAAAAEQAERQGKRQRREATWNKHARPQRKARTSLHPPKIGCIRRCRRDLAQVVPFRVAGVAGPSAVRMRPPLESRRGLETEWREGKSASVQEGAEVSLLSSRDLGATMPRHSQCGECSASYPRSLRETP